jgi:hypothetical protein
MAFHVLKRTDCQRGMPSAGPTCLGASPAFKVSTEPTRVHGTILWNVASMQTTGVPSTAGHGFPAHCARIVPPRGMVTVHWDDESGRPCMPCCREATLRHVQAVASLRSSWSPLSSNRSDFAALVFTWSPTQFKRQTKHKTGGLRVKRGRLPSTFTVRHGPFWACEKDDVRGTDHTRCKSSRSHVKTSNATSSRSELIFTRARQADVPVPGEFGVLAKVDIAAGTTVHLLRRTWSCTSGRPAGSAGAERVSPQR